MLEIALILVPKKIILIFKKNFVKYIFKIIQKILHLCASDNMMRIRCINMHSRKINQLKRLTMPKKTLEDRPKKSLLSAISHFGSVSNFSNKLGVKSQLVYIWLSAYEKGNLPKATPPKRCIMIEKITNGIVKRSDLRPDIFNESEGEKLTPKQKIQRVIDLAKDALNDLSKDGGLG